MVKNLQEQVSALHLGDVVEDSETSTEGPWSSYKVFLKNLERTAIEPEKERSKNTPVAKKPAGGIMYIIFFR